MIAISRCFVVVHDADAALGFYRDQLGFEVLNDVAQQEYRWVTIAPAGNPDVTLVITNYLDGSAADTAAVHALLAKGALNGVGLRTDDLDGLFARLAAAGADVVEQPTDQFWGERDGAVRDPSGNLIRISQA